MNIYPNKDEMPPAMAMQLFNSGAFFVFFNKIFFISYFFLDIERLSCWFRVWN